MLNFINTIDFLGDDVVADSIINRSIVEYKDDTLSFIGAHAFNSCHELTIADFYAVSNIGRYAFKNCFSLIALVLRCPSIVPMASSMLEDCNHFHGYKDEQYNPTGSKDGYIYVPSALFYNYQVVDGWSQYKDQFRILEEWTVDGTTTGELDIENRHMVRFFNSDGTYLGYNVVATGGDATYDDTPVCPEGTGLGFAGFSPSPKNVTSDMDCYAKYLSFETASWDEIAEVCADGYHTTCFNVGNRKPVTLSYSDGTSETINFAIVDMDVDVKSNDGSKAALTLMADNILKNSLQIASRFDLEKDDLYNADNAKVFFTEVLEALPDDLQNVITPVYKHRNSWSNADYLYLHPIFIPSWLNLSGTEHDSHLANSNIVPQSQYALFRYGGTIKRVKLTDTSYDNYWTSTVSSRSPNASSVNLYHIAVDGTEKISNQRQSGYTHGVVPCFCIG